MRALPCCAVWLLTIFVCNSLPGVVLGQDPVRPRLLVDNQHPSAVDDPECGADAQPCSSLVFATSIAPAEAEIIVAPGEYSCGIHVTVPLLIAAPNGSVKLGCKRSQRGIWFDGVYANVHNITFDAGYGEGAGCILVTLDRDDGGYANVIKGCTFRGCVAVSSPSLPLAAGAIGIVYRTSAGRQFLVNESSFVENYARGPDVVAGAMAVVSDDQRPGTDTRPCSSYVVETASSRQLRGVYNRAQLRDGTSVYVTASCPECEFDSVLLFCSPLNRWTFVATAKGEHSGAVASCERNANVSGVASEPKHIRGPDDYHRWVTGRETAIDLTVTCPPTLDSSCDKFSFANAPAGLPTEGLFVRLTNRTHAGRDVFRSTQGGATSWMWFCNKHAEWVVSDSLPPTRANTYAAEEICERALASEPTQAMHPVFVQKWHVWRRSTNSWSFSHTRSMRVVCFAPEDACGAIELANSPYEFVGPFVRKTQPGSLYADRPMFVAHNAHPPQYLSYCGTASDWGIGVEKPVNETSDCLRSFASEATGSPNPTDVARWNTGDGERWLPSPATPKCIDGCRQLSFDARGDEASGVYVASGVANGAPLFRQREPPHHLMFRSGATEHWMIGQCTLPHDCEPASIRFKSSEFAERPEHVPTWQTPQGSPTFPRMSCAAVQRCMRVDVAFKNPKAESAPLFTAAYTRTHAVRAYRPVFSSPAGGTMFYSADLRRWLITHRSTNKVVASEATTAALPSAGALWTYYGPSKPLAALAPGAPVIAFVSCTDEFDAPAKRSDSIVSCTFEYNMGLVDGNDRATAGGALVLAYGRKPIGVALRGTVRTVAVHYNAGVHTRTARTKGSMPPEASDSPTGSVAGGITVHNGSPIRGELSAAHVNATHNEGEHAGVLYTAAVNVQLVKSSMKFNRAHVAGGAVSAARCDLTLNATKCNFNSAVSGGCAALDHHTKLTAFRSDFVNNSAAREGSVVASRGDVRIVESTLDRMHGFALRGSLLRVEVLRNAPLSCIQGTARDIMGGIACMHDPEPEVKPGTAPPPRVTTLESWLIYLATASSAVAQMMLTLTMVVFAYQHFIAVRPLAARQQQASRWRQQQQQQQQVDK